MPSSLRGLSSQRMNSYAPPSLRHSVPPPSLSARQLHSLGFVPEMAVDFGPVSVSLARHAEVPQEVAKLRRRRGRKTRLRRYQLATQQLGSRQRLRLSRGSAAHRVALVLARLQARKARLKFVVLVARSSLLGRLGSVIRRSLDITAGVTGLLTVSPVLAAALVAVRATSPGPILFRQIRVGKGGQEFPIYKIRTMFTDAEQRLAQLQQQSDAPGGIRFKMRRDPRVTPVGRILRKLSIDELPQLWNLVNGTMTLLGPRPPLPREVENYGTHELRRLEVKPGLTCFWQVYGRSDLTFEQQVALDLQYIDQATVADDMRILFQTVPAVLTGKGAY